MCQDSGSLNGPGQTSIIMRMVSDLDIWRTANVIIKQYGQDAPIHAAMRADAMLETGDPNGYAVWKRILRAVEELQSVKPGPGKKNHS